MPDTKTETQGDQDPNGVRVGEWEVGLFGCFTHCVPNCLLMVWCLPCVSLAQISSRIGFYKYGIQVHLLRLIDFKFNNNNYKYGTVMLVSLITYVSLITCSGITGTLLSKAVAESIDEDPTRPSSTLGPKATATAEMAGGTLTAMQAVSSAMGVLYLYALYQMRAEVRGRFQLPGDCCSDFCISFWCGPCSIAPTSRATSPARATLARPTHSPRTSKHEFLFCRATKPAAA